MGLHGPPGTHENPAAVRRLSTKNTVAACVQYLPHVFRRGVSLFTEVVKRDLEGIVAKLRQAPYDLVGGRSPWVKIKNREYSQAVGPHEQFEHFEARNSH